MKKKTQNINELEKKLQEYKNKNFQLLNKNSMKSYIITVLIFILVCSNIFLVFNRKNIDENEFCLEKIQTYYPEYEFTSAELLLFNDEYICKSYFYEAGDDRDSLKEKTELKTKNFILISEEDIEYINSDDFANFMMGVGVALLVILSIITFAFFD